MEIAIAIDCVLCGRTIHTEHDLFSSVDVRDKASGQAVFMPFCSRCDVHPLIDGIVSKESMLIGIKERVALAAAIHKKIENPTAGRRRAVRKRVRMKMLPSVLFSISRMLSKIARALDYGE